MSRDRSAWRRAAVCVGEHNCVEVADGDRAVGIRSSLAPDVQLRFPVGDWAAFIDGVKAGRFDASD
jgi:hypothetical protein